MRFSYKKMFLLAKTYNPGLRIFMPIQIFGFFTLFSVNLAAAVYIDI